MVQTVVDALHGGGIRTSATAGNLGQGKLPVAHDAVVVEHVFLVGNLKQMEEMFQIVLHAVRNRCWVVVQPDEE